MSAPILTGDLQEVLPESLQSGALEADSPLYAKLAKALFAGFYAKLLIPRLGT